MKLLRSLVAVLVGLATQSNGVPAQLWDGSGSRLLFTAEIASEHGYLGVKLADVDADRAKALRLDADGGAEVTNIQAGGPAQKAGIKIGDVLLTFNGETVLGVRQLGRLAGETPPGRKVKLQFWRDGKSGSTIVVTGVMPTQSFEPTDLSAGLPMSSFTSSEVPSALLVWWSPQLGLRCEPLGEQLAEFFGVKHGMLVRLVDAGSSAEKAGVRAGDVLVAIGSRPIAGHRDLTAFLREQHSSGRFVLITLVRSGKEITLSIPWLTAPE